MLKGYRTMVVNAVASVLPILEMTELVNVLPSEWLPWYALIVAVLNMYMRSITTTPVGEK